MSKTFLILGGYGNTGFLIADLLLKHTDSKLIIAGRSKAKAGKASHTLNEKYFDERTKPLAFNVGDKTKLTSACKEVDMVIVASSTLDLIKIVAETAVETGIDYIDIQSSSEQKINLLRSFEPLINDKNLLFITDAGFHPGIPSALVRLAHSHFDRLDLAYIASYINLNWRELEFSQSTVKELINDFVNYKPIAFTNGNWQKFKYKMYKKFDFGSSAGKQTCAPMMLEELREFPVTIPTLRELGFFVSGFNAFVNYFIIPFVIFSSKLIPGFFMKPLVFIVEWGLKKFSKAPYQTILMLSAVGKKDGMDRELRIVLSHTDGYWLTAASVVAALIEYLKGDFKESGLHFQGHLVQPPEFLKYIENLGVKVRNHI